MTEAKRLQAIENPIDDADLKAALSRVVDDAEEHSDWGCGHSSARSDERDHIVVRRAFGLKGPCDDDPAKVGAARRFDEEAAQQPKRFWPEGWPPFAVLRMAHINTGAVCRPSAKLMDRVSPGAARVFRKAWKRELKRFSEPSSH